MHTTRRARRVLATVLTGAVIVAGSLFGGSAATAADRLPPAVMAALGDSITQAIMTCTSLSTCAANSWSTGTDRERRLPRGAARRSSTPPSAVYNDAVSGAKSSALLGQAQKAVTQRREVRDDRDRRERRVHEDRHAP